MRRETERMNERWMEEGRELSGQIDRFVEYFHKHRKCACAVGECRHLNRALRKVLGDRIFEHFGARMDIGIRIYYDWLENK